MMRQTPNAKHVVLNARNNQGDKTSEAASHLSLAVQRHANQLDAQINI
jgi:phosphoglycerate dehydrogenase-like enzyme